MNVAVLNRVPPTRQSSPEEHTWRMTGTEVSALKTLDQAVQEYMQQNDVPGGAIAVARNGRLIFARAYSWSEPTAETTSPTSLFRIASCSKPHAAIHRTPDRREMHDAFAAARRRAVAPRSARRPLSLDVR
ncbi:MAG: serine hydrolase [Gammaproteobacteria bacterium]